MDEVALLKVLTPEQQQLYQAEKEKNEQGVREKRKERFEEDEKIRNWFWNKAKYVAIASPVAGLLTFNPVVCVVGWVVALVIMVFGGIMSTDM